jgi:hypothetical protein
VDEGEGFDSLVLTAFQAADPAYSCSAGGSSWNGKTAVNDIYNSLVEKWGASDADRITQTGGEPDEPGTGVSYDT